MVYCAARFRTDKKFRKYLAKHKLEKRFAKQLIVHGSIRLVQHYSIPPTVRAVKLSAEHGRTDILEWYSREKNFPGLCAGVPLGRHAANHLATLKWLKHAGLYWNCLGAIERAAKLGNVETLNWLHHHGGRERCGCDDAGYSKNALTISVLAVLAAAARGGSIPVLEYLEKHNCIFVNWMYTDAIKKGHLEVVKWLFAREIPYYGVVITAAIYGKLNIIEWAHQQSIQITPIALLHAAEHGHVNILQFAHEHGVEIHDIAYGIAAKAGHLHVIKWLHSAGIKWDTANIVACSLTHTKISKWLYRNGVRYPSWHNMAAGRGNEKLAKWLRART